MSIPKYEDVKQRFLEAHDLLSRPEGRDSRKVRLDDGLLSGGA